MLLAAGGAQEVPLDGTVMVGGTVTVGGTMSATASVATSGTPRAAPLSCGDMATAGGAGEYGRKVLRYTAPISSEWHRPDLPLVQAANQRQFWAFKGSYAGETWEALHHCLRLWMSPTVESQRVLESQHLPAWGIASCIVHAKLDVLCLRKYITHIIQCKKPTRRRTYDY